MSPLWINVTLAHKCPPTPVTNVTLVHKVATWTGDIFGMECVTLRMFREQPRKEIVSLVLLCHISYL